jgi:hypothetical protein
VPVATVSPQDMRTIFSRFIEERQQAGGSRAMTQQQKDELFNEFQRWQSNPTR